MRNLILKLDELVMVAPAGNIQYNYAYLIPSGIRKIDTTRIKLVFHSSGKVDYEKKTYLSITYEDQIQEFLEAYADQFSWAASTNFIHLYVFRPKDTTSETYPEYLRNAHAFTKEVMLEKYYDKYPDSFYNRPDLKTRIR